MVRISCGSWVEAFVTAGFSSGGGKGSGDCVMLDFCNRFFAVADSSGRSPGLSKDLLMDVSAALERSGAQIPREQYDGTDDDGLCRAVDSALRTVLEKHYGRGSSTLTGVLMTGPSEGGTMVLVHTGDSFLVTMNASTGIVDKVSSTNFWMAGKSLKMFQVQAVKAGVDCVALLASDGFLELVNGNGPGLEEFCRSICAEADARETVNGIYESGIGRPVHDDASLVVFRPAMVMRHPKKIVLGGMVGRENTGGASEGMTDVLMVC